MMAGVAVAYERGNWNAGNSGTPPTSTSNNGVKEFGITGDFTWDFGGASLFASAVWVNTDNPNVDDTANPWGVSVQGGYFVTEEAELFARYEYINYDTPGGGDTSKYNGLTFGANYFFAKGVKATVDFTYNLKSLSDDSPAAALNGAGLRQDINGEDGQWALRAQLQLLF